MGSNGGQPDALVLCPNPFYQIYEGAALLAGAQTAFIPLLTLGIPPNAVMALMVGAMTIHGIVPGPQVMTKQPELFWGMIASMWIGNLMLLIINLPLVGVWVKLLVSVTVDVAVRVWRLARCWSAWSKRLCSARAMA